MTHTTFTFTLTVVASDESPFGAQGLVANSTVYNYGKWAQGKTEWYKKPTRRAVRFWVKLEDVNKMVIE
jgi:hypothetical protein